MGGVYTWAVLYITGIALSCYLLSLQSNADCWELFMGNIEELRLELNKKVGWIPMVWSLLIKHLLPKCLLFLFVNLAFTKTPEGKPKLGHYENYPAVYQRIGFMMAFICLYLIVHGIVCPSTLDGFAP